MTVGQSWMPMSTSELLRLMLLNLAYWYVPAMLVPAIVWGAQRFPFEAGRRARAFAAHAVGALTFSVARFAAMAAVRFALFPDGLMPRSVPFWTAVQRQFITDLDWCLMVYGVIVGTSHAVAYYHESQDRQLKAVQLEAHLMEARLKALEAELHPHFLFNTLHAISALVHRDPEAADRMISRLSDLLRITFDRSGDATVTLKEEIEFLEKYLEIEQTRFQDRLTTRVRVDVAALDAEVPRLILQPLVENAIKHGIANRSSGGFVEVSAGTAGDRVWMEVRDNGGGLQGRTLQALRTGVGLSNTRARLECLYPGTHRLVFAEEHGGLAVRVEIPFTSTATATPAVA